MATDDEGWFWEGVGGGFGVGGVFWGCLCSFGGSLGCRNPSEHDQTWAKVDGSSGRPTPSQHRSPGADSAPANTGQPALDPPSRGAVYGHQRRPIGGRPCRRAAQAPRRSNVESGLGKASECRINVESARISVATAPEEMKPAEIDKVKGQTATKIRHSSLARRRKLSFQ